MKLGTNEDFGDGLLTADHKVLLNGKRQEGVVVADNLLGYVDVSIEVRAGCFHVKRKFGSIIFTYQCIEIRTKDVWL